jgi:hypothetical protein
MTRQEITEQAVSLRERAEKNRNHERETRREMATVQERESILLQYAANHATDEDLRIAQLALPGRVSVMNWAEKNINQNGGN